jgi:hypothetical protein
VKLCFGIEGTSTKSPVCDRTCRVFHCQNISCESAYSDFDTPLRLSAPSCDPVSVIQEDGNRKAAQGLTCLVTVTLVISEKDSSCGRKYGFTWGRDEQRAPAVLCRRGGADLFHSHRTSEQSSTAKFHEYAVC